MIIGIKYCGGCNSRYDRKEILLKLQKEYDYQFEIALEDKVYDIVIVLCGCSTACVNHSRFTFKYEKLFIKCIEDYHVVNEILDKYSNK